MEGKVKQDDVNQGDVKQVEPKSNVGGGLVIVAIQLWAGGILGAMSVINGLFGTLPSSRVALIVITIGLIINIVALVLFHKRKRAFVWWYITLLGLGMAYDIVQTFQHTKGIGTTIMVWVVYALLINYVHRSSRVKNRFVK